MRLQKPCATPKKGEIFNIEFLIRTIITDYKRQEKENGETRTGLFYSGRIRAMD